MKLSNIPKSFGNFVVNSKCGTGKTTAIKELIKQHFEEGIVYLVDTVANLKDMLDFIELNLVKLGYISRDDVAFLVSDDNPFSDIYKYYDNPKQLTKVKIILATHVRFYSSLIDYLLIYKTDLPDDYYFDGDYERLMTRTDLRRWILQDESPIFIQPFFTMKWERLAHYSSPFRTCLTPDQMRKVDIFTYGSVNFGSIGKADKIKSNVIYKMIFDNWDYYVKQRKDVDFTITPNLIASPNIQSTNIIFEGCGELLYRTSKNYKLVNIGDSKYPSTVNFIPFKNTMKRDESDVAKYQETLGEIANIISQAQRNEEETLLVCWKDMAGFICPETGKSKLRDQIKNDLLRICGTGFYTLYNGESGTKGTNIYGSCKNIVLLGKWSIPKEDTAKFNKHFGTELTREEHRLWYYVQLISRIGIRHHILGAEFNVFYSSDISQTLINDLSDFFKGKYVPRVVVGVKSRWEQLIENVPKLKKSKDYIMTLASSDETLQGLIELQENQAGVREYRVKREKLKILFPEKYNHSNGPRVEKNIIEAASYLLIKLIVEK